MGGYGGFTMTAFPSTSCMMRCAAYLFDSSSICRTLDACFFLSATHSSCEYRQRSDAVFMSALSTAFSFLLLSFTGFKLISSLALTLFLGITVSYLLSLFMIKSKS